MRAIHNVINLIAIMAMRVGKVVITDSWRNMTWQSLWLIVYKQKWRFQQSLWDVCSILIISCVTWCDRFWFVVYGFLFSSNKRLSANETRSALLTTSSISAIAVTWNILLFMLSAPRIHMRRHNFWNRWNCKALENHMILCALPGKTTSTSTDVCSPNCWLSELKPISF